MDGGVILFVVFIAVAIAVAVFGHLAAKRRREALGAWAQGHGLTFSPGRQGGYDGRFPNYGCLARGSNRYAHNVMQGRFRDRELLAFDYHYETHSTDSKGRRQTHHHHFSAVIAHTDAPLDHLLIRPEGLFDRVKEFFGFDDIDLESAEFSRRFHVGARDKRWAYDVLHPRAMQFLLDSSNFSIQFDGHSAIAWRNRRFAPEDFDAAATALDTLLDGIPAHAFERLKGRA